MTSQNYPLTADQRARVYQDMFTTMTYAQLVETMKAADVIYDTAAAAVRAMGDYLIRCAENGEVSEEDRAEFAHLEAIRAEQGRMCQGIASEISARVRAGNFQ